MKINDNCEVVRMKKVLIYISYDEEEYTNYFHMSIDGSFVENYVPAEDISMIFDRINELTADDSELDWCIAADKNAVLWDYEEEFKKYGHVIHSVSKADVSYICDTLEKKFNYIFSADEDGDNDITIQVLYPKDSDSSFSEESCHDTVDEIDGINKIPEEDDEEKITELAKIIMKKHERIRSREQF
jgi:hypothetical protein